MHDVCRCVCVCVLFFWCCLNPVRLLLESFSHRGVGDVDLLVDRAGGGKLLPGVRGVQVPPQVRQRLRDAEVSVF